MTPSSRRTAENIIATHGKSGFVKLIEMFQVGERGPKIAAIFGVSRQRVHQWKNRLGVEKVVYHPHPAIEDLLPKQGSDRTRISV